MGSKLYVGDGQATPSVVIEKQVPMPLSIQLAKDSTGKLVHGNSEILDFDGVTDIADNILENVYTGRTDISGKINLSDLQQVSGNSALKNTFKNCPNITSVDLSNLTKVIGRSSMMETFSGCTGLTGHLDLSHLKIICDPNIQDNTGGSGNFSQCFKNCPNITSVDLSNLTMIVGKSAFSQAFYDCTNLKTVDLSSLNCYAGSSCLNNAFYNSPDLEILDIHNLVFTFGKSNDYYMAGGNFYNKPKITSVNLDKLFSLHYYSDFYYFFYGSSITEINFPKLSYLSSGAFSYTFHDCKKLKNIRFYALTEDSFITDNNVFSTMFDSNVDGCTIHFPSNLQEKVETLGGYPNFGGKNTIILYDLPVADEILQVEIPNISEIIGDYTLAGSFSNIKRGFSLNWEALLTTNGNYTCQNMFNGCTGLKSINISKFESISGNCTCQNMFNGCTGLTSVDLSSLTTISGTYGCQYMFQNCTSLTTLSFPSLKTVLNNQVFNNMLNGVIGCTVHFPSNLASYNFNCGGTNTTVLYDLPATE